MSYLDQAKSLCILRGALGPVFDAQKGSLLDSFVAEFQGRLVEASPLLSEFSSIGFISADEIPHLLTRLSQSPGASSSSSSPPTWDQYCGTLREDSPLDAQFYSSFATEEKKVEDNEGTFNITLQALKTGLKDYGAVTLGGVMQLKLQDEAFSVLENVFPLPSTQSLFGRLCERLSRLPCFAKPDLSPSPSLSSSSSLSSAFYVSGKDTQVLVIDNAGRQNAFCLAERGDDDLENETNEVILFYLDTSSSMNADENGRYLPPHSNDHPSSSIKKARDLIPPLVRGAVKRGLYIFFIYLSPSHLLSPPPLP